MSFKTAVRTFATVLAVALFARPVLAASAATTLSAQEIVKKTVERAQSIRVFNRQADYSYSKFAVTEEFNGKGKLKEKKEKLLEFQSGYGRLSQLKLNGRALSGAELRKQDEAGIEARQQATDSKSTKRDDNWEKYITPELVAKYSFKLLGEESVNGRSAFIVGFEPASNDLPVNHLVDRLTNRLGGKLWVDEEDFEIARAQVALRGEVALWGGMLGNLKKCNFMVERSRVDDNVWFNTITNGEFEGRKLLEPTHMKTHSESKNFRKTVQTTSR
jgi:hypothetical protein